MATVTGLRYLFPRRWMALLLAMTLVSRLLVPTGFMIAPASAGVMPTIVICNGQGPMTMAMPAAGHHDDKGQHDDNAGEHPCAFASASAAVDLTAVSHPVAPATLVATQQSLDPMAPRPGLGLAAPPPPKTGPPRLR